LVVLFGAFVTWRQYLSGRENAREDLRLQREGRLTERLTKAVGQLSDENVAVRVGGVYALGRLVRESPQDEEAVMEILATYVRSNAAVRGRPDPSVGRLAVRQPEVQAALTVLGSTGRLANPAGFVSLELTATDLRRAELVGAQLSRVRLRDCLLNRANMSGARLHGTDLRRADLTDAVLTGAQADLLTWWPDGFDPESAGVIVSKDLAGADLRAADLRQDRLDGVSLAGARANSFTLWPNGFDWRKAGVEMEADITGDRWVAPRVRPGHGPHPASHRDHGRS
jgi:hypothetical protein